ncbi:MAG: TolC family protein [Calditrichota bacterium]
MKLKLIITLAAACGLLVQQSSAISLDEAIRIGKAQSLRMEEPRIEKMRTDGRVREAWSLALPQIEGQIGYQRAWKSNVVFFPNPMTGEIMPLKMQQDNAASADVTLTQPLMTFGRVSAGIRAAYAADRSTRHLSGNTERSLELEIQKSFWTVLLARDVVEIRRASLAISDSSLQRAIRLRDVGLMSDYDVLRVRVQAHNQRPLLQQAENNLRLADLAFREVLGVPLDTTITADGQLDEFTIVPDTLNSGERITNRDDLEALRAVAEMQKNIYVIYRNAAWPTLGGQVKYSWQWQNDRWAINPQNNASSVYGGIALTIPILTSGGTSGLAKQFKADWRRSEWTLAQAERGAKLHYESAIRSYQTALENEEATELAVQEAQEARRIAQTKFEQGQITPLEMDAAQLDELVARVARAQAKYDRLAAGADVKMAMGESPFTK